MRGLGLAWLGFAAACAAPEVAGSWGEEVTPASALDVGAPPPHLRLDAAALQEGRWSHSRDTRSTFRVTGARPGDVVHLGASLTPGAGACYAALGGRCLDIVDAEHLGSATADASGVAELFLALPGHLYVGDAVHLQAGSRRALSNVLERPVQERIELEGVWTDDLGVAHEIEASLWRRASGVVTWVSHDNNEQFAVGLRRAHPQGPNAWVRLDWTRNADGWWLCESATAAPNRAAAENAPRPDDGSPASLGCGPSNGPWRALTWTLATPQGDWVDEAGEHQGFSGNVFWYDSLDYQVRYRSNFNAFVVAVDGFAGLARPWGKKRLDWAFQGSDTLRVCMRYVWRANPGEEFGVAMDLPAADRTDMDRCGCGAPCPYGDPWDHWTRLPPAPAP